jgi:hypothetical protein
MMKKLAFRILLALLIVSAVRAATLTIDIPTADVPRISEAFGALYGLGHNASMNEVAYITRTQFLITQTELYEKNKHNASYVQPPLVMEPTPTVTPTATPTPTATATATESPSPTATPTP